MFMSLWNSPMVPAEDTLAFLGAGSPAIGRRREEEEEEEEENGKIK